jgi:hypothetical protein
LECLPRDVHDVERGAKAEGATAPSPLAIGGAPDAEPPLPQGE